MWIPQQWDRALHKFLQCGSFPPVPWTAPARFFPWCTVLQEWFGFPTWLQLLTENLLLCSLMGLVFSTDCRRISALVLEAPAPPPSLTLVSVGLFPSFSSLSQLLQSIPLPFLNYVITGGSPAWVIGSVWSSFGAFRSSLEPALSNMRQPQVSSHRSHSFKTLCYQTLTMTTQGSNSQRKYKAFCWILCDLL